MGLGGFFKKLFGKGDQEVVAPAAQGANPGVPGAVDSVGTTPPAVPVSTNPTPASVPPVAAPVVEKTA